VESVADRSREQARARLHYLANAETYKRRAAVNKQRVRQENRLRLREFVDAHGCRDCGLHDVTVLEFDHRDPAAKRQDVNSLIEFGLSWHTIALEMAKCDVVCANCHRRRTARQFGWRRLLGLEPLNLPELPKRGSPEYERIKSCRSTLARRHRNRAYILAHLVSHPCVLCGETDIAVLDFDHRGEKRREVTVIAVRGGWTDLLAEIDKCRVLCANCHRRETARKAGRLR
jgi:hypothetical protein